LRDLRVCYFPQIPQVPADFRRFPQISADFRRFRRFSQIPQVPADFRRFPQIYADYADGGDNCHFGMVDYSVTLFYATDNDLSYGVYAFPFRDRVA
jgi:hypothetical protein